MSATQILFVTQISGIRRDVMVNMEHTTKLLDCKTIDYKTSDSTWLRQELDVPFVPTPYDIINQMLSLADLQASDTLYDLGCGDGRIVITSAQKFGAKATGIDIDPYRISECNSNASKAGISEKISFVQSDIFSANISDATVITLYLLTNVNVRLQHKFFSELRPGTRIISHDFTMDSWPPDITRAAGSHTIYKWITPGNFSGTWHWNMHDHSGYNQYVLNLSQNFQMASGDFKLQNDCSVIAITVMGTNIEIHMRSYVHPREYHYHLRGIIKGNCISGIITSTNRDEEIWTAHREPHSITRICPE